MPARRRILIVDDDREIMRGLRIRLEAGGYEVLTAIDGAAGVDIANSALPDVILLDISLPGMDGMDVLATLRAGDATRTIPIVVLSANVLDRAKSQALDLGARLFVGKPYTAEQLLSVLNSVTQSVS